MSSQCRDAEASLKASEAQCISLRHALEAVTAELEEVRADRQRMCAQVKGLERDVDQERSIGKQAMKAAGEVELEALARTTDEWQDKCLALQTKVQLLEGALQERATAQSDQLEEHRKALELLKGELESERAQRVAAEQEATVLNRDMCDFEQTLDRAKAEGERLAELNRRAAHKHQTAEQRWATEMGHLKDTHAAEVAELRAQHTQLKEEVEIVEGERQELETEVGALRQLQHQVGELNSRVSWLEGRERTLEQQEASLKAEVADATSSMQSLQQQLEKCTHERTLAERAQKQWRQRWEEAGARWREQQQEYERTRRTLEEEVAQLQQTVVEQEQAMRSVATQMALLGAEEGTHRQVVIEGFGLGLSVFRRVAAEERQLLVRCGDRTLELHHRATHSEAQLKEMEQKLAAQVQSHAAKCEHHHNELTTVQASAHESCEALRTQLTALMQQYESVSQALAGSRTKVLEAEASAHEAGKRIESLEVELQTTTMKLQSAEQATQLQAERLKAAEASTLQLQQACTEANLQLASAAQSIQELQAEVHRRTSLLEEGKQRLREVQTRHTACLGAQEATLEGLQHTARGAVWQREEAEAAMLAALAQQERRLVAMRRDRTEALQQLQQAHTQATAEAAAAKQAADRLQAENEQATASLQQQHLHTLDTLKSQEQRSALECLHHTSRAEIMECAEAGCSTLYLEAHSALLTLDMPSFLLFGNGCVTLWDYQRTRGEDQRYKKLLTEIAVHHGVPDEGDGLLQQRQQQHTQTLTQLSDERNYYRRVAQRIDSVQRAVDGLGSWIQAQQSLVGGSAPTVVPIEQPPHHPQTSTECGLGPPLKNETLKKKGLRETTATPSFWSAICPPTEAPSALRLL
eukprot:NODE_149_length_2917_cov_26.305376_g95_i1.p1 GENE.NODE_149_length_2917_cov_26.305376_g95_i1~~NODE_149_length_2917_cov_26.305376_g95_i1.p1  ORF type:complete len:943 (-),score=309.80 NODE_149_length_2917_cov_26.305376_g95_i1:89-2695(-)